MSYEEQVAGNVRAEAERYRVPVADMAEAIGISVGSMYARLSGDREIRLRELPILARVIGVPLSRLTEPQEIQQQAAA